VALAQGLARVYRCTVPVVEAQACDRCEREGDLRVVTEGETL
jgi:hypothetical protein